MVDFSIVIPVYGTDEFLPRCIRSIKQSFTNTLFSYEIIVVDDGSITPISINESNCVLIRHEINSSCLQARISGFTRAKGHWILTVDPDDELWNMDWQGLKSYFEKFNADIVMFSMERTFLPQLHCLLPRRAKSDKVECFFGKDDVISFYNKQEGAWTITAKVYSANIVKKVANYIHENKSSSYVNVADDFALTTSMIVLAKKIVVAKGLGVYLYCCRSGSLTNSNWLEDVQKTKINLKSYQVARDVPLDFIDGFSGSDLEKKY